MQKPFINNDRLWPSDPYRVCTIEDRETALARLPAEARRFLDRLVAEYPKILDELTYLHCRRRFHPDVELYSDEDEVIAIFDRSPDGFGIQIDPLSGVIVVWNEVSHGEFADWGSGTPFVDHALQFIRESIARRPEVC